MNVGDKIPEILGIDQDGREIKASDYRGRKIVLYSYPKANTSGCTAEACSLQAHKEELAAAGYEIIGVSKDKQALQKKFAETKGLQFPLIADTETTLLQELGCWGEKVTCGAFLEQRKQAVAADRDEAQQLQEAAEVSKAAYEEKLKAVHKEAEEILSASRKAAMKQQDAIIDQAKSEASAIMEQADRETVSEKQRIKADVRKEMCGLALAMTGRFADHADPQRGEALLEEALKEMGGEAWLN